MRRLLLLGCLLSALLLVACGGGGGGADEKVTPPPVNAELAAAGKEYFNQYACSTCHSMAGQAGIGPALNGIYGKKVQLEDGSSVVRDDAYLRESILQPDAKTVKGYPKGSMTNVIMPFMPELQKPEVLDALVEYIKSTT
jgi:cytochrome c oxidase subunit 2